jgi:serine/threonine protein phosphatase PrpC
VSDPSATLPTLSWGAATDSGRVRTENEDTFVAEATVFGVAYGMGGHQAGEVASDIATTMLRERLRGGASSVDVVVAAVVEANAAIFQGAHNNAEQRGMGTTLTAVVVLDVPDQAPRLALVNVGDSRTYVSRGGRLRRVTIDHSYVQELVSTGHITEQEARNHPRRNIVTRALGIEPTVKVDTWLLPMVKGDRFVLCSDGLVDEVADDEIAAVLTANADAQAAADALVAAANANGGRDNVTVVVVDVLVGDDRPHDTADMEVEPAWGDEPDRLIDAEAGATDGRSTTVMPVLPKVAARAAAPARAEGPTTISSDSDGSSGPRARGRLGTLLFVIGLGIIITFTVVLVLVVRHNSNPSPTTPTTTTTTTTTAATTTTPTTTAPTGT